MNDKQSFIIEDLDDNNVVIKADEEWRVRRELEAEVSQSVVFLVCNDVYWVLCMQLEKNTYSLE